MYVSTASAPGCARTFSFTASISVATRGSYPRLMMRSAITRIRPLIVTPCSRSESEGVEPSCTRHFISLLLRVDTID
jgi:hypothetical protein